MDNLTINHRYYSWTIASGDYYRDYESTESYAKEQEMKRRMEKLVKLFFYLGIPLSLLFLYSSIYYIF
ncbi:MAG: hypothetical protein P4L27_01760 [Ignavibacteriaceae bacterium]|nr:hypothetical protein [Ignavibacteriaceae bacterium]